MLSYKTSSKTIQVNFQSFSKIKEFEGRTAISVTYIDVNDKDQDWTINFEIVILEVEEERQQTTSLDQGGTGSTLSDASRISSSSS